jgi:multisubunit Na+/H+ antiporter MnhB subunit
MIIGVVFAVVVIIIVIAYIGKNAKSKDEGNKPGA